MMQRARLRWCHISDIEKETELVVCLLPDNAITMLALPDRTGTETSERNASSEFTLIILESVIAVSPNHYCTRAKFLRSSSNQEGLPGSCGDHTLTTLSENGLYHKIMIFVRGGKKTTMIVSFAPR